MFDDQLLYQPAQPHLNLEVKYYFHNTVTSANWCWPVANQTRWFSLEVIRAESLTMIFNFRNYYYSNSVATPPKKALLWHDHLWMPFTNGTENVLNKIVSLPFYFLLNLESKSFGANVFFIIAIFLGTKSRLDLKRQLTLHKLELSLCLACKSRDNVHVLIMLETLKLNTKWIQIWTAICRANGLHITITIKVHCKLHVGYMYIQITQ